MEGMKWRFEMARITEGARIGGNIIRGVFLAGAVVLAGVAVNAIGPQIWDSWSANVDRIRAEEARGDRIAREAMDKEYALVCEDYFKASFIDRNLTYWNYGWCEDYRDRMPGGAS
jgi:hypothetical protein